VVKWLKLLSKDVSFYTKMERKENEDKNIYSFESNKNSSDILIT